MTDLTDEDKKLLAEAVGQGMGGALQKELPNILAKAEESKKEYIERLTRIEAKLDAILMVLKVVSP